MIYHYLNDFWEETTKKKLIVICLILTLALSVTALAACNDKTAATAHDTQKQRADARCFAAAGCPGLMMLVMFVPETGSALRHSRLCRNVSKSQLGAQPAVRHAHLCRNVTKSQPCA